MYYLLINIFENTLKLLFICLVVVLLYGCGAVTTRYPPTDQYPQEPVIDDAGLLAKPSRGPANSLYLEAKRSLSQGDNQQAEIAIERAIRIEPSNPYYWYAFAKIKYRQGQHSEAIQLCLKSKSLAGRNSKLIQASENLIDKAKRDSSSI